MRKILFPLLILSILCFMSNCDENTKEQMVTITFKTYGGTEIQNRIVPYSSTITVPPPVKDGWSFQGWFFDPEFTMPSNLDDELYYAFPYHNKQNNIRSIEIQCYKDITLYAKFSERLYRVIYDGNGNTEGEVPVDNNLYAEGDMFISESSISAMSKDNYLSIGWLVMNAASIIPEHNFRFIGIITFGNSDITFIARYPS